MQQLVVKEFGERVYVQNSQGFQILSKKTLQDHVVYSDYFTLLISTVAEQLEEFEIVLEITESYTLMTLPLNKEQAQNAETIKKLLLESFHDDIEDIGIKETENGVVLNIRDFFFEFFD